MLLTARGGRTRPARDDKVVAAWNGMAIGALAEAGVLFARPDLVAAAEDAAELLVSLHYSAGRIVRTSRDGVAGPSAGLLEDYACVAAGLLELAGVSGGDRWVEVAGALLDTVLTAFGDGNGGFYDTAEDGERLIFRPADPTDNATPSGAFAAADALLSYGALTGEARYTDAAVAALRVLPPIADRYPGPAAWACRPPRRCCPGRPRSRSSAPTTTRAPPTCCAPRCTWPRPARSSPSARVRARLTTAIPLLAGRSLVSGAPTAYVCRGFTCLAPVTTLDALREALLAR